MSAIAAAKPCERLWAQRLGPLGDRLVTARATHYRGGGAGQHAGQQVASTLGAAWVRDGSEEGRQGLHVLGVELHSHGAVVVLLGQQRATEQGAGITLQRLDKDLLGLVGRAVFARAAALIADGIADILPVARPVEGTDKAPGVDKGFQQQQRKAKARDPVGLNSALAQRQYLQGEVGVMMLGKNQEARLVGDQVQPIVLMAQVPAETAIARTAPQGRGRKAQQCRPLRIAGGDIPQGVTDLRQSPQVMMRLHQGLKTGLFGHGDGAYNEF